MWLVHKLLPLWLFTFPFQENTGLLLVVAGFVMTFSGVWIFRQAATTVDPMQPEVAQFDAGRSVYLVHQSFSDLAGRKRVTITLR